MDNLSGFDSDNDLFSFNTTPKKRRRCDYITCNNIEYKLENLVNNSDLHDVVFKLGNSYVYACKLILINGSTYFANMFKNFKESKDSKEQKYINIRDIEYKIFENIIKFITTGCIKINADNIVQLCMAAKFYELDDLVHECTNSIQYIDDDNLNKLLKMSCKEVLYNPYCIDDAKLIDNMFIWKLIEIYLQKHKISEDEIWYKVPIEIVKIYMMTVRFSNENNIFEYMLNYAKKNAKNEKQKLKILDELKKYVKLPYVDPKYMHDRIIPLKLYSNQDIYEALLYSRCPEIYNTRRNEYKFIKRKKTWF